MRQKFIIREKVYRQWEGNLKLTHQGSCVSGTNSMINLMRLSIDSKLFELSWIFFPLLNLPRPWKNSPKPWNNSPRPWNNSPKPWNNPPKPWNNSPRSHHDVVGNSQLQNSSDRTSSSHDNEWSGEASDELLGTRLLGEMFLQSWGD